MHFVFLLVIPKARHSHVGMTKKITNITNRGGLYFLFRRIVGQVEKRIGCFVFL